MPYSQKPPFGFRPITSVCAHRGHLCSAVDFPKAGKASRGLVGRDGWKTAVHSARFERQRRAMSRPRGPVRYLRAVLHSENLKLALKVRSRSNARGRDTTPGGVFAGETANAESAHRQADPICQIGRAS